MDFLFRHVHQQLIKRMCFCIIYLGISMYAPAIISSSLAFVMRPETVPARWRCKTYMQARKKKKKKNGTS